MNLAHYACYRSKVTLIIEAFIAKKITFYLCIWQSEFVFPPLLLEKKETLRGARERISDSSYFAFQNDGPDYVARGPLESK